MTFIDPRGKVFAHLDRLMAWQRGDKPSPVTVEWDLSNRCTLGCQDCHFAHTHVRGPWTMKSRQLPMAFQSGGDLADPAVVHAALLEMATVGVKGVIWSGGGEPTTHPNWIDIVASAQWAGLEQGMYTLGGLFTEGPARYLAKTASFVVVSLDAADRETYAAEKGVPPERFDSACQGIRWLAAAQHAAIGVSFLLHAGNWTRMQEMRRLARELGATYTTFRPAIRTSPAAPSVCTDDRSWVTAAEHPLRGLAAFDDVEIDVDRFLAYRDWTGHGYSACKGIQLTTTITPDGRVWICPQRRGLQGSCLGDLRTETFAEVWRRHPGHWTDFSSCRVMCRLHLTNQQIAALEAPRPHAAFV